MSEERPIGLPGDSSEASVVRAAVRAVSGFNVVAEYVYSLLSGCQFV